MSKGRKLAKELGIDFNQALFSKWGNFYAPILDYPCVLFDEKGFLIVNSSDDLDGFGIKLQKRTNVPKLISSVPTYQLLSAWRTRLAEEIFLEDEKSYFEGAATAVFSIATNEIKRLEVGVYLTMDVYVRRVTRSCLMFMVLRLKTLSMSIIRSQSHLSVENIN